MIELYCITVILFVTTIISSADEYDERRKIMRKLRDIDNLEVNVVTMGFTDTELVALIRPKHIYRDIIENYVFDGKSKLQFDIKKFQPLADKKEFIEIWCDDPDCVSSMPAVFFQKEQYSQKHYIGVPLRYDKKLAVFDIDNFEKDSELDWNDRGTFPIILNWKTSSMGFRVVYIDGSGNLMPRIDTINDLKLYPSDNLDKFREEIAFGFVVHHQYFLLYNSRKKHFCIYEFQSYGSDYCQRDLNNLCGSKYKPSGADADVYVAGSKVRICMLLRKVIVLKREERKPVDENESVPDDEKNDSENEEPKKEETKKEKKVNENDVKNYIDNMSMDDFITDTIMVIVSICAIGGSCILIFFIVKLIKQPPPPPEYRQKRTDETNVERASINNRSAKESNNETAKIKSCPRRNESNKIRSSRREPSRVRSSGRVQGKNKSLNSEPIKIKSPSPLREPSQFKSTFQKSNYDTVISKYSSI